MTSIHVKPAFSGETDRQKACESAAIAAHIATFQRKGGQIEVLGNSALRPDVTRRQVQDSRIEGRKKAGKA